MRGQHQSTTGSVNGLGLGWTRTAEALAAHVPPSDIKRIWIFQKLRRDEREWGTAVAATVEQDERLRIFTARYMLVVRGKEKGQGKVEVSEIGASHRDVVEEVLRGVQDRASETEPPIEISPDLWFGGEDDRSAAES